MACVPITGTAPLPPHLDHVVAAVAAQDACFRIAAASVAPSEGFQPAGPANGNAPARRALAVTDPTLDGVLADDAAAAVAAAPAAASPSLRPATAPAAPIDAAADAFLRQARAVTGDWLTTPPAVAATVPAEGAGGRGGGGRGGGGSRRGRR